uniref:Lipoprotein n=1 Tax=Trieres chinensis TaxID=1514140 RepID=A0A7S2EP19_TRICV|mmetsp:Transcript_31477/g.64372  ORF Transcript_31477/g.64372 Transcript_31477/m.64372 type:complete len:211 (+) Transcript_31477:116-748(+)
MSVLRKLTALLVTVSLTVACGSAFVVQPNAVKTPANVSPVRLGMSVDLVDPSYNLAIGAFGIGLAGGFLEDVRGSNGDKLPTAKIFGGLALVFTLFAAFITFQTTTLRFGFDDDSFSLVRSDGSSLGENVVVGGENRWAYSSFKNWDFLPSKDFPILVYFREDQTPLANREEVPIVVDELDGQVHFFPAISNTKQLKDGFVKHDCAKVEK